MLAPLAVFKGSRSPTRHPRSKTRWQLFWLMSWSRRSEEEEDEGVTSQSLHTVLGREGGKGHPTQVRDGPWALCSFALSESQICM